MSLDIKMWLSEQPETIVAIQAGSFSLLNLAKQICDIFIYHISCEYCCLPVKKTLAPTTSIACLTIYKVHTNQREQV